MAIIQKLYGHRYALRKADLLPDSRTRLTEIHPYNLQEALAINPGIMIIGLVTSDFSLLHERLSTIRKTENHEEIVHRINVAKEEIKTIQSNRLLYNHVIEVTRFTQNLVFDQVHTILRPYLTTEGR